MALAFTALSTALASTSNASSYAGNAGTPAAGDLLICFVLCSGQSVSGTLAGTFTWNLLYSFTKNSAADIIDVFWAYAATATSTTPTYTVGGPGNGSGAIISAMRVTGAEGQVQPYIRQFNTATGTGANPALAMDTAILTGNGVLGFATNGTNSATQWTAPTSFTEVSEVAYNSPANSGETVSVASGVTASTLTWTNANTTAWGVTAIEFYVAGTGPSPINGMTGFFGGITSV